MKVRESGKDAKPVRKFTGTREGGIGDSSMYFVMRQEEGGVFKATPVEDWYNFKPEIKHRTLTHEGKIENFKLFLGVIFSKKFGRKF